MLSVIWVVLSTTYTATEHNHVDDMNWWVSSTEFMKQDYDATENLSVDVSFSRPSSYQPEKKLHESYDWYADSYDDLTPFGFEYISYGRYQAVDHEYGSYDAAGWYFDDRLDILQTTYGSYHEYEIDWLDKDNWLYDSYSYDNEIWIDLGPRLELFTPWMQLSAVSNSIGFYSRNDGFFGTVLLEWPMWQIERFSTTPVLIV